MINIASDKQNMMWFSFPGKTRAWRTGGAAPEFGKTNQLQGGGDIAQVEFGKQLKYERTLAFLSVEFTILPIPVVNLRDSR